MLIHFSRAAAASVIVAVLALSGCTAKENTRAETTAGTTAASTTAKSDGSAPITVDASDSACTLSANQSGTGKHSFVVTNNGTKVTEFYVYGPKNEVLAEVENIPPGLKRTLDVDFPAPGTYRTSCKPGMVGDGISAEFAVTG